MTTEARKALAGIVDRLRAAEPCRPNEICNVMDARSGCICAEAADEIERLRSAPEALSVDEVARERDEALDAIAYALSDISISGGNSVCGYTKALMRKALGRDHEDAAHLQPYDDALRIIIECDEAHGKPSPLRALAQAPASHLSAKTEEGAND